MIAHGLLAQLIVATIATRPVLVTDATSGAPVASVSVSVQGVRAVTGATGVARLALAGGDTIRVRRVGYRALSLVVPSGRADSGRDRAVAADTVRVALWPVAAPLAAHVTIGEAVVGNAGRLVAERTVADAREAGVASTAALLAALPFVAVRGARGEATLSMRGGRPEQVAVTLDGLALNAAAMLNTNALIIAVS